MSCDLYSTFYYSRGVGGSISNDEMGSDIGAGVNGEKLGTGYAWIASKAVLLSLIKNSISRLNFNHLMFIFSSYAPGDHGGFHPEESRYYKVSKN